MTETPIYLDFAAATPVDPTVLAAMQPYWTEKFYNPSSIYLASREVKQALEDARAEVAHWLGVRASEIIFTAGASEANNLLIKGIQAQNPDASIAVSAVEHAAVLAPANRFDRVIKLPVDQYGLVEVNQLKNIITDTTVLVTIVYANNEIGTVQHLSSISDMLAEIRQERSARGVSLPLYFHTDASQAANYLDLHVSKLGIDSMTLNGAKTYGPKQSGALYLRGGIELLPLIEGGGQEHSMRSGTEQVANAVGFATALTQAQAMRKSEQDRLLKMRRQLVAQLLALHPKLTVHGHRKQVLPNIVSFSIAGLDAERAVMALDEHGIQCATGAACSASNDEPSHVIQALGYDRATANATIRISMGRLTTDDQLERLLDALSQVLDSRHNWLTV